MGTNYCLHQPQCPLCKHQPEPLHIGKSSIGWVFALHVMPEKGINDLDDWKPLLDATESMIKDEYGDVKSSSEMLEWITDRSRDQSWDECTWFGYKSEAHFHRQNNSIRGPNNLLRHQIDREYCLSHGAGTWDCLAGSSADE